LVKVDVPSAEQVAKKWVEEAPKRAVYYKENTIGSGSKWESETGKAADTYKAAVQAADIGKRFKGGVKGKGAKFDRKVEDVGATRYGPGIQAAEEDMKTGVSDYLSEIAATDIDERGPRGDPGNWARSQKIGDALHKKRLAKLAAG